MPSFNFLIILSLISPGSFKSIIPSVPDISFDILHVNDIHAHFDPVNAFNGRCRSEKETCYGGLPRLYKALEDLKGPNTLLFNAGDYYQGSIWYTKLKYEVVLDFANMLGYSGMSLGNHEFDDDLSGITPFVDGAEFPVLACNIRNKKTQEPSFQPSYIDNSLGKRIGVIGYVSTNTPTITNPNIGQVLEFTDEVECIREEARRLIDQGVQIIIALGHSGYEVDQKIAKEVQEVDIVVGGHSHTFLYPKGETPPLENENIEGDYPTYVTQASGRVVPVVQAYCFSKYLGQFRVNFGSDGELLQPVEGVGVSAAQVHLLDGEEDDSIIQKMKPYKERLSEFYVQVGEAKVDLRAKFMAESNLGNLVADSMIDSAGKPEVLISFVNNGGLRSDIGEGIITLEDVVTTLPFENSIELITIKGSSIKTVLEGIASKWGNHTYTTFLQVSAGVRLRFHVEDGNEGSRLLSFKIKCEAGWCDLEDDKIYEVILPSFIARGGFDSPNFADFTLSKEDLKMKDSKALLDYIKSHSPVEQFIEDRIVIQDSGSQIPSSSLMGVLMSFFFLRTVSS